MKVYIGQKKETTRYKYGITIYSDSGQVLHSAVKHEQLLENRFDNAISLFKWGINKIKALGQNGKISESEPILLITESKTVYTWFENEDAPEPYTISFSDLLLEASFLLNHVELLYRKDTGKKVLYRNTEEDKGQKITDLFKL